MLKGRLTGLPKKLKVLLLGSGVLLLLFLVANVALGFSPKKIKQVEDWCYSGLSPGILNDIRTIWCKPSIKDSFLFIAKKVSQIVEPSVQPQVEIVDWELQLYNESGKQIKKWEKPTRTNVSIFTVYAAAGAQYSSKLHAVLKNSGSVSVHGIEAKIKLYRGEKLVSEVNPFHMSGVDDETDLYAYIPSGGNYIVEPEMPYPPEFDKAELEITARSYQPSLFESSFIPLDIEFQSFGLKKLAAFGLNVNSTHYVDNFDNRFDLMTTDYISNDYVYKQITLDRAYAVALKLTNTSEQAVTDIRVESSFTVKMDSNYARYVNASPSYVFRMLSERAVEGVDQEDEWLTNSNQVLTDPIVLQPRDSVVLLRFMGYEDWEPGWVDGHDQVVKNNLKIGKIDYIYSWGEVAE